MTTIISQKGDSVDLICWRYLGQTAALCEETLSLNPGLAAFGPILPAGIAITLAPPAHEAARPVIQLWD